jgi:hypothetical protein
MQDQNNEGPNNLQEIQENLQVRVPFEFLRRPIILGVNNSNHISVHTYLQYFWVPGVHLHQALESRPRNIRYTTNHVHRLRNGGRWNRNVRRRLN